MYKIELIDMTIKKMIYNACPVNINGLHNHEISLKLISEMFGDQKHQ